MDSHFLLDLSHRKSRRSFFHQNAGQSFRSSGRIRQGKDQKIFCLASAGDKAFCSVYDILSRLFIKNRRGLCIAGVRSRIGLCQGKCAQRPSVCCFRKILLFLFFCSKLIQHRCENRVYGKNRRTGRVFFGDFCHSQYFVNVCPAASAVFFRRSDSGKSHLTHFLKNIPWKLSGAVYLFCPRLHILFREFRRCFLQHFLPFCQSKIHNAPPAVIKRLLLLVSHRLPHPDGRLPDYAAPAEAQEYRCSAALH